MDDDEREWYDRGWNARLLGLSFDSKMPLEWQDGWDACNHECKIDPHNVDWKA